MNGQGQLRNTAITSIWSHIEEIVKGTYPKQETQVKMILEEQELNSRQIHHEMCRRFKYLDVSSCRRAITGLLGSEEIEVSKLDKCPITGKTVRFYKIAEAKKEGQARQLTLRLFDSF